MGRPGSAPFLRCASGRPGNHRALGARSTGEPWVVERRVVPRDPQRMLRNGAAIARTRNVFEGLVPGVVRGRRNGPGRDGTSVSPYGNRIHCTGGAGESVSRVLCAGLRPFGLRPRRRPFLWDGGCPPPPAAYPEVMAVRATPRDPEIPPSLCGLAPGGACRAGRVAAAAVGAYPAVSPLPRPLRAVAVCFLLRFPWPCGRWALPTTLLCGARTFLEKPLARFPRSPGLPCKGDGTGTFLTK